MDDAMITTIVGFVSAVVGWILKAVTTKRK